MINKIIKEIKANKTFLITAHVGIEGDALGSELATYAMLKKLKKTAVIFNDDFTPAIYSFLPFHQRIHRKLPQKKFDVAMVLDCSDSSRAGAVKDYLSNVNYIINIDHHISNTNFGDINWIDPKASSASQMVYTLCKRLGVMDKKIATCIYTGIFTDTGNFTYSSVTPETHEIVASLLRHGIDPQMVHHHLHSLCSKEDLLSIGKIISSLKFDTNNKICWAVIDAWKEKDYDLTEVIFSIMRISRDTEVFLLFKKIGTNKIRVNFRSRFFVDVNKIAQFFGGGGHKRASGTTIIDSLEGAEKKVISFVRRYTGSGQPRRKSRA
jgi:phosphoesterase RecJ-like protein